MKLDVRFSIDFAAVSDLQKIVARCCRLFYSGGCYDLSWSTLFFKCFFDPLDVDSLAVALYDVVFDDDYDLVSGRDYWFGVDLDQGLYFLGYDDDFVFFFGHYCDFRCHFRNSKSVALRS